MKQIRLFVMATALAPLAALGCGNSSGNGSGECASDMVAGDLVITEIMANPDGQDDGNEWFEIYNTTAAPIDLTGLSLVASKDDGSGEQVHNMRQTTIASGQYLVVGGVLEEFKPGHVDYGYANDLTLRNSNGRLALRCGDTLIDEASYVEVTSGASLELDGSQAPDALRNDELSNFCDAKVAYDQTNLGTPQEPNDFCVIVAPGTCNDANGERDTVQPAVGDVAITEIMPNAAGADGDKEWFEVVALADFDLNGLNAGTEPGNPRASVDSPDCIPVKAGDRILWAQSDDPAVNGGLPAPDAIFGFTLKNGTTTTGDGQLVIGIGDQTLDAVTWTDSGDGVALNLDPGKEDPTANDTAANFCAATASYGDEGNLGTPRAENTFCVAAGQCVDPDTGMPRDVVKPGAGELKITEWMANPTVISDPDGEWFEVQFLAAADLNGVEVGSDMGTVANTVVSSDCIPIGVGKYAVFAHNTNMMQNGGVAAQAESGFQLVNGGDRIFVGIDGTELDSVTYVSSTDGHATQVDQNGLLCDAVLEYDKTNHNFGTPGTDNSADCNNP